MNNIRYSIKADQMSGIQASVNNSTAPTYSDYASCITANTVQHLEAVAANRVSITSEEMANIIENVMPMKCLDTYQKKAITKAVLVVLAGNTALVPLGKMQQLCILNYQWDEEIALLEAKK